MTEGSATLEVMIEESFSFKVLTAIVSRDAVTLV